MTNFNDYSKTKRFELFLNKLNINSEKLYIIYFWIFFVLSLFMLFKSITHENSFTIHKNRILKLTPETSDKYPRIIFINSYNEVDDIKISSEQYDGYIILSKYNKVLYYYEKENKDNYKVIFIIATIISAILAIIYLILYNE